jgi:hypothetical protein
MSDRHYDVELVFPDGTKVYPSSHFHRTVTDDVPDYALYLDDVWTAYSVATFIPWKDYGLPKVPYRRAAESIIDAFCIAKDGMSVEIGCIGGHGRTGTVLACMAVLAGVPGKDAVTWVKTNYCKKAVESTRQEWFVLWFEAYCNNAEAPPEPPPPPPYQPKKTNPENKKTKETNPVAALQKLENSLPHTGGVEPEGDLEAGDQCPACGRKLFLLGDKLCCTMSTCKFYKGLPTCPICDCHLDAHQLYNYACWNANCRAYMLHPNTVQLTNLIARVNKEREEQGEDDGGREVTT